MIFSIYTKATNPKSKVWTASDQNRVSDGSTSKPLDRREPVQEDTSNWAASEKKTIIPVVNQRQDYLCRLPILGTWERTCTTWLPWQTRWPSSTSRYSGASQPHKLGVWQVLYNSLVLEITLCKNHFQNNFPSRLIRLYVSCVFLFSNDCIPVSLGGDHLISYPILRSYSHLHNLPPPTSQSSHITITPILNLPIFSSELPLLAMGRLASYMLMPTPTLLKAYRHRHCHPHRRHCHHPLNLNPGLDDGREACPRDPIPMRLGRRTTWQLKGCSGWSPPPLCSKQTIVWASA